MGRHAAPPDAHLMTVAPFVAGFVIAVLIATSVAIWGLPRYPSDPPPSTPAVMGHPYQPESQ